MEVLKLISFGEQVKYMTETEAFIVVEICIKDVSWA